MRSVSLSRVHKRSHIGRRQSGREPSDGGSCWLAFTLLQAQLRCRVGGAGQIICLVWWNQLHKKTFYDINIWSVNISCVFLLCYCWGMCKSGRPIVDHVCCFLLFIIIFYFVSFSGYLPPSWFIGPHHILCQTWTI